MIFLDTHLILWLYDMRTDKIPAAVQKIINEADLFISPAVELEIELLYEIKRIKNRAYEIIEDLNAHLNVTTSDIQFHRIIEEAKTIKWTRDPFDRMIVANASIFQASLVTKDELILKNYKFAVW